MTRLPVPSYDELASRGGTPSAWGVFGDQDDVGTINFITPDAVLRGTQSVKQGRRFNLNHSLDAFVPPLTQHRKNPDHKIFRLHSNHRDDYVDSLYTQASTQIDGLRHVRHPIHGFYNGMRDDEVVIGTRRGGVQRWAEAGIATRGVLVDVAAFCESRGDRLSHEKPDAISPPLLEEVAKAQGVNFEPGDALLIRTGWQTHYFRHLSDEDRKQLPQQLSNAGLEQSEETVRWLWDRQFALIASDNMSLERLPVVEDSPFSTGEGTFHDGMMHRVMIPLFGMAIGELWALDDLAQDCADDGQYGFLLVAVPLMLPGGVGSPANAIALK